MAYATNTYNTTNPGPVLYTALSSLLTSAGFTSVDTVTISTRTHNVWKSPAAGNAANLDWYLDVGYPTTGVGSEFTIQPFEFYDPATDLGYRGVYSGSVDVTIDATTSSRYGATGYALETNWLGNTSFNNYALSMQSSTQTSYWFSVTPNRVIHMTQSETQYIHYSGLYEPDPLYAAKAGANIFPLVGMTVRASAGNGVTQIAVNSTGAYGGLTRVPPATTMGSPGWGGNLAIGPSAGSMPDNTIPGGSTVMYPFAASRLRLLSNNALQVSYGFPYDFGMMSSTAAQGDTVTISGASWVLSAAYTGFSLLFKAA